MYVEARGGTRRAQRVQSVGGAVLGCTLNYRSFETHTNEVRS